MSLTPGNATLTAHVQYLDTQGYTVLENLLTPQQVAEAVAGLKELYEREKAFVTCHEPQTNRCFNLTARGEIYRQIIQLPDIVACVSYLLGDDYILSDMSARSPLPGKGPQHLHRDGGKYIPNPPDNVHAVLPISAQVFFVLVDFTPHNGATRLVPGSHARGELDPAKIQPEQETLLIAKAGSVLIYDNRLIHGGGANYSNQIRYSIQGFCCRRYVKPFCDHTRSIPRDIVENATPLMRRLWGFECQSMYEHTPRHFRMIDVPGAKQVFDYNFGVPAELLNEN